MLDLGRLSWAEDSEGALPASIHDCLRDVLDLDAREGRTGTLGISDGECVCWHLRQGATGVVEDLQRLIAGVGDGRNDLQVLNARYRL